MQKYRRNKFFFIKLFVCVSIIFLVIIGISKGFLQDSVTAGKLYACLDRASVLMPTLTPWQSVGGCGAGGSGGGTDGIKWVGEGVSGGYLEVEVLPKYNFGQNFHFLNVAPRFSFKPKWNTTIGLTLPFASKTAGVQYRTNQNEETKVTGGMSDLSLDVSRDFGSEGQFTIGLAMTFPTGQYDIKRGPESAKKILPNNLQIGSGVYSAGLTVTYSRDVENGLWLFDGAYNYPFALRLFSQENEFLDTYYSAYKNEQGNSRFYYRAKHYGENDLGDYIPPSLSVSAIYAYRGVPNYVHSVGLTLSVPLAVAWIHSENVNIYDPRPDPDHKAWQMVLTYGLEFSRDKFPVFMAVALPIHDKSPGDTGYDPDPMKKWNGPDWEDFFRQWILAVGIKSAMF